MKRLIRIVILSAFLLSIVSMPVLADPQVPNDPPPVLFLPVIQSSNNFYTLTGTVRDVDSYPVANVKGDRPDRRVCVHRRERQLRAASAPRFKRPHCPARQLFVPAAGCRRIRQDRRSHHGCRCGLRRCYGQRHGRFRPGRLGLHWRFCIGGGTDATIFNSPLYSGRTGINPASGLVVTYPTELRATSQVYPISHASFAYLGVWVYQVSSSTGLGEADRQLIRILDEDGNPRSEVFSANANTALWTYYEYSLSSYVGKSIKVEFASFNDGIVGGGTTGLYFDDVSLVYCSTAVDEGECRNLVVNGTFEATSAWF